MSSPAQQAISRHVWSGQGPSFLIDYIYAIHLDFVIKIAEIGNGVGLTHLIESFLKTSSFRVWISNTRPLGYEPSVTT